MKKKIAGIILAFGLCAGGIAVFQQSSILNIDIEGRKEVQVEAPKYMAPAGNNDTIEETIELEEPIEAEETIESKESMESEYIESVFNSPKWHDTHMSSVGEVCFPVFVVEFPDAKFENYRLPNETIKKWIFTDDDSVAAFYETSSNGRLHMDGDIYSYMAQNNFSYYEKNKNGLDNLVKEIIEYTDDEIDFSKYNKDGDIFADTFVIAFPFWEDMMDAQFWWSSYNHVSSSLNIADNTIIANYVIVQGPYNFPSNSSRKGDFIYQLKHELGHALGLPDYYKPNYTDFNLNEDGLPGAAGVELMDDEDDRAFSQFSKLQLGWLTKDQVQIMNADADNKTFLLPPASEGGCILIFPEGKEPNFQSEYLLVEYITPDGEWKGYVRQGGVRILHVQAALSDGADYKYSPISNGARMLKLVNGDDFYHTGDTVTFSNTGAGSGNFGWYDPESDSGAVYFPGFSIQIGEIQADSGYIQIEVKTKDSAIR